MQPIIPFDMLTTMRQHVCSNVLFPRHIVHLQIKFSWSLQPVSLASIEMWLDKYVCKWFMVSVHMADIPMQAVPPLHTCQIHSHRLPVGYMIMAFSGGELLTVECHWASSLRKLSTHSNNRGITGQVERLFKVWQC